MLAIGATRSNFKPRRLHREQARSHKSNPVFPTQMQRLHLPDPSHSREVSERIPAALRRLKYVDSLAQSLSSVIGPDSRQM